LTKWEHDHGIYGDDIKVTRKFEEKMQYLMIGDNLYTFVREKCEYIGVILLYCTISRIDDMYIFIS